MKLFQYNKKSIGQKIGLLLTIGLVGQASASDFLSGTQESLRKGLNIAVEADKRDNGFGDTRSNLVMVMANSQGEKSTRNMRTQILEQANDGDKSLLVFDNPRDVKGTAFLSFTHKSGPDSQWLFLPALKRVKRLSSSNKSGPFVGSEFAYEDISSQEVEKYNYNYLRDETMDGREHFVIARDPVDPKSGYSYQEVWIDKNEYRTWKIVYYDRKKELLKTLIYSDYQQYLDKYWRANLWSMVNHQTNKSTELRYDEWTFRNGYTNRDFSKTSLSQIR